MPDGKYILFHEENGTIYTTMFFSLALSLVLTSTPLSSSTAQLDPALTRPRLEFVVSKLQSKGFSEAEITKAFGDKRVTLYPQPKVTGSPIDWAAFERGLLSAKSVSDGKAFAKKYATTLANAQRQYGVDKYVIVAIIRMESSFGKWMGSHSAFNVFYTNLLRPDLTEAKWKWAGENLAALMQHSRNTGVNVHEIKSSWAGAVGMAQFLPASIISFGKDGNRDGKIFMTGAPDAIMSAANFLAGHGWKSNPTKALTSYYGSGIGYPAAALKYAKALAK
jgi:membrane-bound lytic murein transglycosylase B